jgi:glycosyltransferase involved in cell wall biosynthesis
MAKRHGIESSVHLAGRVPHTESLRRMQSATALLAVQSPEDDVHVPGKLFEYIGARRPIFAMSRPCETADLIVRNNLGWVADPEEASVAEKLAEAYAAWQARGHAGLALQLADQFGIQERTRQLVDLLEEICNRK